MKKVIRLTEGDLHRIIENSVKRILKENKVIKKNHKSKHRINEGYSFNHEEYYKWADTDQIPKQVKDMVQYISEKVGCSVDDEEKVIELRNRGGHTYAFGKGFTISYCTSSLADGPGEDYSDTLIKWIEGIGFRIENSYGDNGMDSATNYNDTYWHYDFVYEPSIVSIEKFVDWDENDDEDDDMDESGWDEDEFNY